MKRLLKKIVVFCMLISCCSAFGATAYVDDEMDLSKAIINENVNSIVLKTPKYNMNIQPIGYFFEMPFLLRTLSISGSRSPFGNDANGNIASSLYFLLQAPVRLGDYNFSLKNLAVSNNNNGVALFDSSFIFDVDAGRTLTLNNVLVQTDSNFEGSIVTNEGVLNLRSTKFFNIGTGSDITNNGTINLISGNTYFNKGIDGSGTTNIKSGLITFNYDKSLTQDNLKITGGALEINPEMLNVPNVVNNVKYGIRFKHDKMDENGSSNVFSHESLNPLYLSNTHISGKGSVRIESHVVVDSTSSISQSIYIPAQVKNVIEKASMPRWLSGVDENGNPTYEIIGVETTNDTSLYIEMNGDNFEFYPIYRELYDEFGNFIDIEPTGEYEVWEIYDVDVLKSSTSLTANADNIKGTIKNNSELYLTGGTLTKAITGSGDTYIKGEVVSNAKINQDIVIESKDVQNGRFRSVSIDEQEIVPNSLTINAGYLKKGINIFNYGILYLTSGSKGANLNVGLVSDGKVVILDAIIGNKSVFDENYLEITDKGTFITNASLFKNYDYSDIKSIKNEGVLRFSGGYLRAIDIISNTGDNTDYDISKGVVEVSGKVFLEKTTYSVYDPQSQNDITKEVCPTIYQYINIGKKGNLTTSADSLKGNVVSYGTLKLTDGTLQIPQTEDRAFAIQNMGKLTINEDVNILSDIDNFSTITMTNAVIGYKDPDVSNFGKLSVSDNFGLIENYRTLTLKSYVDKTLYVQNIDGLAIRNEYNSYTGKKVPLLTIKDKVIFRNNTNSSGNGGAILNISDNNSRKPKVVLDGTSTGYYDESILDTSFLSEFRSNSAINGGAISNEGGTVSANSFVFVYNTASGYGGSIYNLEGTYSAKDTYYYHNSATISGGAIYNADVAKISYSSFFKNEAKNGGAIYNDGSLTITNSIVGGSKFIPIYHIMNVGATKYYYHPYGYSVELPNNAEIGAGLYNTGVATITSSSFYNNIATNLGGAIYNQGKLTVTSSDFHNNIAQEGGAIYSNSNEKVVISKSDFEDNSADNGGAVYFNSGISEVKNSIFGVTGTSVLYKYGEEIKREEQPDGNNAINGGAIYNNENSSTTITSCEFLKNTASLTDGKGGDIYNAGTMTINKSYFGGYIPKRRDGRLLIYAIITKVDYYKYVVSDEQLSNGWEVNTEYSSSYYPINPIKPIEPVKEITPYDIWGASALQGGAIYNTGTLTINSSYIMNAFAKEGGGLYNESNNLVKITSSTFENNLATDVSEQGLVAKGGAIYNNGNNIQITKSKFNENKSDNFGGAIYNANTGNLTVTSSTFTGNYAVNDEKSGCGGAIYADGVTTITSSTFKNNEADFGGAIYVAQNAEVVVQDSSFTNNIANVAGGAIYVDENASLTINAVKKDVTFSGNMANGESNSIYLAENSFLTLHTEKKRKITIKDNIEVADGTASISITGAGKTYIVNKDALNDIIVKPEQNSTMSLANSNVETTTFKGLNLEGTSNVELDASLKTGTADKVQAETVEGTGTLNVSIVNVVTNSKTPVEINVGKDSVVSSISTNKAESAEATYKLKSYYDENGLLRIVAYGQRAKSAAIAAPIAAQIGGYLAQINSYDQAFGNLDTEMLLTREERDAREMMNKYACASGCASVQEENTINLNSKGLWNRAFATFEKVNLSGGPNVSNVGYGNYFGGDMGKKALSNGWSRQMSAYIGYNGSTQDYDRQSIDQNGGTIGLMETWYKGNFFTALTANVGGNNAQAHTDIGRENMSMLMAGVASKTGYNFEFKNGKFIVQPSLLVSYSFIHTFEHNNGLGHRVSSDPIHAIQVAPGVKFVANLKNGWQPYFGINMRWNIMDKSSFSIPDVTIPTMSVDPYVEYGFGLQKRWGDRFTGYGQAMIRNGGRNGVMLSIGFRWAIGK